MRAIAALALMVLAAPAYPQTLEQLERQKQIDKVMGMMDQLGTSIEKIGKEKRLQCITAVANEPFCECLERNLPLAVNFVGYVTIITQTKEELKYNTLSAEDKELVDNTRKVRDQCLGARR